jgi:hypothetical protein
VSGLLGLFDTELDADFFHKPVRDLAMPWYGRLATIRLVSPDGMVGTFACELAPVTSQVLHEGDEFHQAACTGTTLT